MPKAVRPLKALKAGYDEGMQAWAKAKAHKEAWRVKGICDCEDLIQDAFLIYARCKNRYPDVEQRHLMALFKTSYSNHIHDLARQRMRHQEDLFCDLLADSDDEARTLDSILGTEQPWGPVFAAVGGAKSVLGQLLTMLSSGPAVAALRAPLRTMSDGSKETLNDRWRGMLKLRSHTYDLCGELKKAIKSAS